jgi:glutamine synthetase adenylyltransferase
MDEDRQTHTLPPDGEDLDLLARKMPPAAPATARDGDRSSSGWTNTWRRCARSTIA